MGTFFILYQNWIQKKPPKISKALIIYSFLVFIFLQI